MPLIPKLQGVTYAGSGPAPVGSSPGPGGNMYGGEWEAPMTTGGPVVSGIQEYLAKLQSQGLPPTPQNVNRIREATSNGVTLPRPPIPPAEGATSAPPTSVVPPDPNASSPGAASSGLLASLAPAILGGAPLAAILGRQYLDSRGKPPGTPADIVAPAPAPGADLLNTKGPGFEPEVPRPPGSITDTAGFKPEYGNAPAAEAIRSAVAPAEVAPRPLLQTAGVDLQPAPAPARAPSGPGFDPEIPPSPVKEAIDKALPADEPAPPRAKTRAKPKAKIRIRA